MYDFCALDLSIYRSLAMRVVEQADVNVIVFFLKSDPRIQQLDICDVTIHSESI